LIYNNLKYKLFINYFINNKMAENSYLLFCIIERIQHQKQDKNYVTKKEILKYIEPIALFWDESHNFNLFINKITNIIFNINNCVENNVLLLNDNKFCINKDHIYYSEYKKCYFTSINKIELLTDSIMLTINKKISNSDELMDVELLNNKLNDIELVDTIKSVDEDSEEEELEDTYYVCESFTSNDIYFINPSITHCSCLAFHYSDDNKSCKHIEYFKKLNYEELNKKYIINTKNNSCNCTYFKSNSKCKHLQDFLEASSY